jgi:NAD(P)-dependent dehydrogenase (short-subunit alcohol dehydrogenase family)
MAQDYQGSAVYVVGGSMGIGLAAAKAFAERGADVLLFARRREPLETAAREVERSRRSDEQRVGFRTLDVCDAGAVESVMSEAVSSCGVPDVLFNCAGRAQPGYFEEIPAGQLEEIMRVNLFGTWSTVQTLLPHMKGRGGTIVNTSSLAGLVGVFGYTDYCAAKFAVIGFSEALRSELARHGMRVFVLCPPDTETPGLEEESERRGGLGGPAPRDGSTRAAHHPGPRGEVDRSREAPLPPPGGADHGPGGRESRIFVGVDLSSVRV